MKKIAVIAITAVLALAFAGCSCSSNSSSSSSASTSASSASATTSQQASTTGQQATTTGSSAAKQVQVPNVVGMEANAAANTLQSVGLSPDGNNQGTVTAQTPAAGTMLAAGDTVSIVTDGGNAANATVAVPNVVGMDAASAAAAIQGVGLSPDGMNQGTVTSQAPAAGTMLAPGDTVSIVTDAASADSTGSEQQ